MPLLSVVVPFYNVEKYIDACLASIAAQTLSDFEVICVDDGSADASAATAAAYAAADPRFRLITQPNAGLGPARNAGAAAATGRYLAFADSDDVIPPRAYQLLVSSLERTGSDLACGNVRRLTGRRLTQSWAHREAFAATLPRTHISAHTELVRDRMAWNKVFRRAFWDAHGLAFPARMYEDQPVMIPAHVLADGVDVHSEVVYHWRERDDGAGSITQRRLEPENVRDRLLSVTETAAFLEVRAPELKPLLDAESMEIDLRVAAEAVVALSPEERDPLLELACDYLDGVEEETWRAVPALTRLQLRLLHRRMLPELRSVLAHDTDAPVRVRPGGLRRRRWYADYPLRGDRRIPADSHDVTGELRLRAGVDRLRFGGGGLRAQGRIWLPGAGVADLAGARLRLALRQGGKEGRAVPLGQWRLAPGTAAHGEAAAIVADGDEVRFELDLGETLPLAECEDAEGTWQIRAELAGRGLDLETGVAAPAADPLFGQGPLRIGDGLWIIPAVGNHRRLRLRVRCARAAVTRCVPQGAGLRISGWARANLPPPAEVAVVPQDETAAGVAFPAELDGSRAGGVSRFTADIPLAGIGSGTAWRFALRHRGARAVPLAFDSAEHVEGEADHRRFVVTRSGNCNLVLRERTDPR
ncbi:glycosyltransferase [Spongiactinospora sp. TRM90649]|uniref:glycosyltransferase family 2 protein n=1 Tax=Spongiactinospora sp. TRM90649 TaxID=3031114 RepID=UPI0023F811FF|nr:glycosyltransferase [Spongiactinospora sp. TRM90649]MDF5751403.1 glycosyltransferase [Spongiactinospora sp. TRM90649]